MTKCIIYVILLGNFLRKSLEFLLNHVLEIPFFVLLFFFSRYEIS